MNNPSQASTILAVRKNNSIRIQGKFDGRIIDENHKIDEAPWFQATSLSFKGFVQSHEKEIVYWTLRPNTLKPYKLRAVKKNLEKIDVAGTPVTAVKIESRLTGWRGPFWKSTYWFNAQNGYFIRFESIADLQGSSTINVSFTGKERARNWDCSQAWLPDGHFTSCR
jgi:hypothetical protein